MHIDGLRQVSRKCKTTHSKIVKSLRRENQEETFCLLFFRLIGLMCCAEWPCLWPGSLLLRAASLASQQIRQQTASSGIHPVVQSTVQSYKCSKLHYPLNLFKWFPTIAGFLFPRSTVEKSYNYTSADFCTGTVDCCEE